MGDQLVLQMVVQQKESVMKKEKKRKKERKKRHTETYSQNGLLWFLALWQEDLYPTKNCNSERRLRSISRDLKCKLSKKSKEMQTGVCLENTEESEHRLARVSRPKMGKRTLLQVVQVCHVKCVVYALGMRLPTGRETC